jgi:hypothetical protein
MIPVNKQTWAVYDTVAQTIHELLDSHPIFNKEYAEKRSHYWNWSWAEEGRFTPIFVEVIINEIVNIK